MIPKIIHQLWIGPLPAPINLMQTWKDKHPDFEYILWTEKEIETRGFDFQCQSKIDMMDEINGKADIMRWEILCTYGGYFIDADSICIEPFDDYFAERTAFATFENEMMRAGLIATGTMGFIPNHPLCKDIINWINSNEYDEMITCVRAWGTVGPGVLTRFLNTGQYADFTVYPSHCFLPIHFTGVSYSGHKKVYAHQLWGTANRNYETMNSITLPTVLSEPTLWVSVLIPSHNTCQHFIKECLESIKLQNGFFGIEIVWVNDGSDVEHTEFLKKELFEFINRTRFTKLVYLQQDVRKGVSQSLHNGLKMCSKEIVFRMDSDDIMLPNRMQTQIDFMRNNTDCVLCGTNMQMFTNNNPSNLKIRVLANKTEHSPKITWAVFSNTDANSTWLMNHPTLCFYKSAVMSVGNYNIEQPVEPMEDYDLELRIMQKYGAVYNIDESLLLYRIHPQQVTCQSKNTDTEFLYQLRQKIIESII